MDMHLRIKIQWKQGINQTVKSYNLTPLNKWKREREEMEDISRQASLVAAEETEMEKGVILDISISGTHIKPAARPGICIHLCCYLVRLLSCDDVTRI